MKRKKVAVAAMIAVLSVSNVLSSYAGWQQMDTGRWKYQDGPAGWKTNSWFKDVNEKWYHFDANGEMQTGWFRDVDGKWYFFNADGSMATGWFRDVDGKWYFMSISGEMQTGLINVNGRVYYMNPTGELFVGEKEILGQGVFYFTENGTTNGQPETENVWTSRGVSLKETPKDKVSSDDGSHHSGRPEEPEEPEEPEKPELQEIQLELGADVTEVEAGSQRTLTVKVVPKEAELAVSSDNEAVLEAGIVENIVTLTGLQAGTANVTVSAEAEDYEPVSLTFSVTVTQQPQEAEDGRQEFNFNTGWMFSKGVGKNNSESEVKPAEDVVVIPETEKPYELDYEMDDTWTSVSLPHTYNDVDTFDNFMEEEGSHHGERSMYTGTAWYKKEFSVPASYAGKKVFLEFEAARQAAHVYLNGELLEGVSENGFIPFGYDLTPYLKFGETNQITVMVDNSFPYYAEGTEGDVLSWHDSHWHPTHGGLYRNANLHVTDKLHVTLPLYSFLETQGTYVYTADETEESAKVYIEAEVQNEYDEAKTFTCSAEILDMDGNVAADVTGDAITLKPGEKTVVKLETVVENPIFWSDQYPYMYQVDTVLDLDGEEADRSATPLGIRVFRFTNDSGVFLNENYIKLEGWGQKSTNEWAGLGAAYPDWMHDFVIKLMKDAGGNFIRWGHTAGSPTQIELSDKYGLVVEQPGVDGEGSTVGGVYSDTAYRVRKDAFRDMIIYYRNNPSIFMWELGNQSMPDAEAAALSEIVAQYDHHGQPANAAKVNAGSYDNTKASSQRLTSVRRGNGTMAKYVDVGITTEGSGGMNTDALGNKPEVEGEYNREEARRGVWDRYTDGFEDYKTDSNTYNLTTEQFAVNQVSNYKKIAKTSHGGGANWIFSDSTSHGRVYSEVTRASGEVDAVMLEKEAYYALKTIQTDEIDAHIIGHWNYPDGTVKPVYVTSDAEKVELFLNGRSLGFGQKSDNYLFTFNSVTYEPGTLEAVGYDLAGNEVCRAEKATHGKPYAVKLTSIEGPQGLLANGSDVLLIDAEVVDEDGNRCLNYDGQNLGQYINFTINDDNGCSIWRGGYNSGIEHSTNNKYLYIEAGITRVAVRTTMKPGDITVTGSIDGLESDTITVTSQPVDNENGLSTTFNETYEYSLDDLTYPGLGDGEKPSDGANISVAYKSALIDNFSYSGTETKVKASVVNPAAKGRQVYTDKKDIVFGDLPLYLVNEDYFQLPNADTGFKAEDMVSFGALKDITVYVAHDDRIPTPEWLEGTIQGITFSDTGEDIKIGDEVYSLFSADAKAGQSVTLSSNAEEGGEGGNMYTVFITETGCDDEFFADDFEGSKTGSAPSGWIVLPGSNAAATVVEQDGNQAVQLYDTNATSGVSDNLVVMAKEFLPQGGKFSVEWDLYDNRMAGQKYVRFVLEEGGLTADPGDKNDWAVETYLNEDGRLDYRDGSSDKNIISGLEAKQWHHIKYVVDMVNKTFDVYVNDALAKAGLKFLHGTDTVNTFIIGSSGSKATDILVDNVEIKVLEDRLESLDVNGVTFDRFDAEKKEIILSLPEDFDKTRQPEIKAQPMDVYAEAEVSQPSSFDEAATVTVTPLFGEPRVYTVKFEDEIEKPSQELGIIFEDDFESYKEGETQPGEWVIGNASTANKTKAVVQVEDGTDNKVMYLEDLGSKMLMLSHEFERETEHLAVEFDVMHLDATEPFFRTIVNNGPAQESGKTAFLNETYVNAGKLTYKEIIPSAGTAPDMEVCAINQDTWYTIRYEFDFAAQTYDIYVDDECKVEAIPFLNAHDGADCIYFGTAGSKNGHFLLDNIKVYGTNGVILEDPDKDELPLVFESDFDAYEVGDVPEDWYLATASNAVAVIAEDEKDGDLRNVVRLKDTNKGNAPNMVTLAQEIDRQSERMILEYEVKDNLAAEKRFFRILINDGKPEGANYDNKATFVTETYISNGNLIYRTAADPNTDKNLVEIKKDQWYKVKYDLDFEAQAYNIYVDNKLVADAIPFRNELSGADYIVFATGGKYEGDVMLANICIYGNGDTAEASELIFDEEELLEEEVEVEVATGSNAVMQTEEDEVSTEDGAQRIPADDQKSEIPWTEILLPKKETSSAAEDESAEAEN